MSETTDVGDPKRFSVKWWLQAINTIFLGSFKIPGWVGIAFAIFWGVPAWHSKFEFWARIVQSSGGWLTPAADILLWPFFAPTLALISVLYIAIVTVIRPTVRPVRNAFVAAIGWVCVTLIIVAVVSVVGSGAIEFYIRKEIAKGAQGLPRDRSPADPKSAGNERPLFANAPRSLTTNQTRLLIEQSTELKAVGPITIRYLASDMEAFQFGTQLRSAIILAGAAATQPHEDFLGNADTDGGLFIEVPDQNSPPEKALKLQRALAVVDLPVQIISLPPGYVNIEFILFVGPRPVQR